jgi:hypothetical protein
MTDWPVPTKTEMESLTAQHNGSAGLPRTPRGTVGCVNTDAGIVDAQRAHWKRMEDINQTFIPPPVIPLIVF